MNVEMQGALGNLFGLQNQGMAMGGMGGMGMGQQPMMGMFPGMFPGMQPQQPQQPQPNFMNLMMPPPPVQQAQAPAFMMPPPQPPPAQMMPHSLSRGPAPVAGYAPMSQVSGGQFVNPQVPGFNMAATPPPAMEMAMSNQNPLNMLNMGVMNPAPNPHTMHGMIPRSSNNHNPQRRM